MKDEPAPSDRPWVSDKTRNKVMLLACCAFGFFLALELFGSAVGYRDAWEKSKKLAMKPNADVSNRYNDLGRDYDAEVETAEKFMFMPRKRRRLITQAKGNVLEVSVGTGRNMEYYDLRLKDPAQSSTGQGTAIKSLVFNDQASVMIDAARKRFEEQEGEKSEKQKFAGWVEFVEGDAGIKGVVKKPEGGFDTIVQTMGLCSIADPVGFLRMMGELCKRPRQCGEQTVVLDGKYGKVVEDDGMGGRILLLEHGRGYYGWLNWWLDGLAAWHADLHGCWWNKDIGAIVKESGLKIEYIKRYHLGTTWEVVLRPMSEEEKAQDQDGKHG